MEGEHIEVSIDFEEAGEERVFYFDPATLEIDSEYTDRKQRESRERSINEYLAEKELVIFPRRLLRTGI